jgi:hypothetical protein
MERDPAPHHMTDFAIHNVMESYGKEHRRRYFTTSGYHKLMEKDGMVLSSTNSEGSGQFFSEHFDSGQFYSTESELKMFQDTYSQRANGMQPPESYLVVFTSI